MPRDLVTPQQWVSRTGLMFRSRGTKLEAIDDAYYEYYEFQSRKTAHKLYVAMKAYLEAHGRFWAKVDRNTKSDGLMEDVFRKVQWTETAVPNTAEAKLKAALAADAPKARLGVLYLFSNLEVNTQGLSIALEGGFSLVGGSTPLTTGGLSESTKGYVDGGVGAAAKLGGLGAKQLRSKETAVTRAQHVVAPKPPPSPSDFDLITLDTANWGPGFYLMELGAELYQTIKKKIGELVEWAIAKIQQNEATAWSVAGKAKNLLINAVVGYVAKHAAPFVGAGLDILGGVTQAISAAKQRIQVFLQRAKFQIQAGHPELLANAIEKEMNWAIGAGLFNALKGAGKVGLLTISAGASAIGEAIMAGVEFIVKTLLRWREGERLRTFLAEARTHYAASAMPDMEPEPEPDWEQVPTRGRSGAVTEPPKHRVRTQMIPRPGSLVTDLAKFTAFFESGCNASPCVPMLTLNSGICGDLTQMMRLFDDAGAVLEREAAQTSFDAAAGYFTTLKGYGKSYMKKSGFTFTSPEPTVRGLLGHAVGDHADGPVSKWDAALGVLGA